MTFDDGAVSDWLNSNKIKSSGLDETALVSRAMATCTSEVREVCARLPTSSALDELWRRVAHDELPLLSLLQVEPLQLQSSHLSFQEFFCAQALCEGTRLSGAPPWQWPAWWKNVLVIGKDMGDTFAHGLLHAAGVEGEALDLSQKLGGDRPTVLMVLCAMLKGSQIVELKRVPRRQTMNRLCAFVCQRR